MCFCNPGTSEISFVGGLDATDKMRGVLCLFEGVATGAADGYGRMKDWPAATLLHLGPGLGNGVANLHNARRGPDPRRQHRGRTMPPGISKHDAPLTSDIEAIAGAVSGWYHYSGSARDLPGDTARAVQASLQPPGQVATLVLPVGCRLGSGRPTGRAAGAGAAAGRCRPNG